jgi:hypothetical protein
MLPSVLESINDSTGATAQRADCLPYVYAFNANSTELLHYKKLFIANNSETDIEHRLPCFVGTA